jgi:Zn-dependent protease with chaperone function/tellurite resistance protein
MGFVKLLLLTLGIPIIGYFVSAGISGSLDDALKKEVILGYEEVCSLDEAKTNSALRAGCDEYSNITFLGKSSVVAGGFGLSIIVIFWVASLIAGRDRKKLSIIFPPLIPLSLLLISISVLLQGAILTYSAYIGEIHLIQRVHYFLIGAIGLGALVGAINLISAAFSHIKKMETTVLGVPLSRELSPTLFKFVDDIGQKLGATIPKNIVIGLEPTFYVTAADVNVIDQPTVLTGETLYISAPLARLFSREEFAAVIGHELGHFRGEDTVYSMKFAPVYAGLSQALIDLDGGGDASEFSTIPAYAMLEYMMGVFSKNERFISRERELRADEAGVDVSSPFSLATALAKFTLYSGLWGDVRKDNYNRLVEGKITGNLSRVFEDSAKYDVEKNSIEEIIEHIVNISISHPTDTHPTLNERLKSLGIESNKIKKEALFVPKDNALDLINNSKSVEEELTVLEHKYMIALGQIKIPEEEKQENQLLEFGYALAAAMVAADGKILPEEINTAEGIGVKLFDGFDPVDFRAYCENHEELPNPKSLAEVLKELLTDSEKKILLDYLKAISEADGDVDPDEEALLKEISQGLDFTNPA